ncbi:MAG: ABC transporter ATP-binding protein [Gemmatimonadota bacterium]
MPLLSVRDLRTYFSTDAGLARAVDGVSFDIDRGETLGIVGESGCGKTVTSLSVMGLIPDPPGRILPGSSIRLRDRELLALPEKEMRRVRGDQIAMIFQEPMTSLNPVYTVGNQIQEALRLHRNLGKAEARRIGIGLLREVGIPEPERRFGEFPHQLSGGMRQRIMIAMALSCEPDLLIADEPTTALDVTIQAQILELLADIRGHREMAVLLITHDLGVVAEVCDRVVVMYAGQVVESGTVHEIFHRPRHPYTEGLLASLPDLARDRGRMHPIEGTVPSAVNWPSGCRFRARCPHAWHQCGAPPPLLDVADQPGRASRCWLEEEPSRRRPVGGEATHEGNADSR